MLNTQVTDKTQKAVARPLRALVPVIKHDLEQGDKAADKASAPYYERAGLGLLEAAEDQDMNEREFWLWAEEAFGRKRKFLRAHMEIAFENNPKIFQTVGFETMADFLRAKNKRPKHVDSAGREVERQIRGTIKQVNEAKRNLGAPEGAYKPAIEKEMRVRLAYQLIDIGYKALATQLHPDVKGGSEEAMVRLNRVRDMLKGAVR